MCSPTLPSASQALRRTWASGSRVRARNASLASAVSAECSAIRHLGTSRRTRAGPGPAAAPGRSRGGAVVARCRGRPRRRPVSRLRRPAPAGSSRPGAPGRGRLRPRPAPRRRGVVRGHRGAQDGQPVRAHGVGVRARCQQLPYGVGVLGPHRVHEPSARDLLPTHGEQATQGPCPRSPGFRAQRRRPHPIPGRGRQLRRTTAVISPAPAPAYSPPRPSPPGPPGSSRSPAGAGLRRRPGWTPSPCRRSSCRSWSP